MRGTKSEDQIKLDRELLEAVGCPTVYGGKERAPDPLKVKKLLDAGALPDFYVPRRRENKRQK